MEIQSVTILFEKNAFLNLPVSWCYEIISVRYITGQSLVLVSNYCWFYFINYLKSLTSQSNHKVYSSALYFSRVSMSLCTQVDQAGTENSKWQRTNCLYIWGNVRISFCIKRLLLFGSKLTLPFKQLQYTRWRVLRFDEILTQIWSRSTAVIFWGLPFIMNT